MQISMDRRGMSREAPATAALAGQTRAVAVTAIQTTLHEQTTGAKA